MEQRRPNLIRPWLAHPSCSFTNASSVQFYVFTTVNPHRGLSSTVDGCEIYLSFNLRNLSAMGKIR